MLDRHAVLRQLDTIVKDYLDGHQTFEAGAQEVASILRPATYLDFVVLLYSESARLCVQRRPDHIRGLKLVRAGWHIANEMP
jgi:hypothetical protein